MFVHKCLVPYYVHYHFGTLTLKLGCLHIYQVFLLLLMQLQHVSCMVILEI
jgi:hypothetical protein